MGWRKQDRQTQKLFDSVTKSLLQQTEAQDRATSSYPYEDIPLKEEHPIGSLLLLRGAGPAAAKGLEFIGEKMMPSAFLKGVGQTFPKVAKATTAISPYADAGLLATWGAEGLQSAKKAVKSGDAAGAIAGASMAALPLMGINPEVVQELKSSQKVNNIARALNKEIKGTEIVDSPVTQNILAGKLGWAPGQSRVIWHNSESPISKLESTFPAWDTVERGAPLGHVWGTGSETNLGFIGKRPFHLRSTKPVEMNKPMVQLNESIGSGKNTVRNEILKFADQSGADAVNFSNIKDNTLSNQDVYAVLKDVDIKPKLSEAERLGIPKGERSNLTQDQLEALDDLVQFNKSGKYKTQLYIDNNGKIHWGRPNENQKTFIQEAAESRLSDGAYGTNGVRFRGHSPYYNGTVTVGYDNGPKMTAFGLDFPTDYGSATFSATPHKTGTLILTSPRSDFYDPRGFGIENEALSAGESLTNIISKDLMKNYWTAADDLIQPGTYLSGDTGQYPIGINAIRDIRDNKGMTSAISKILYPELQKGHANGLSVDAYSSIIRQGQRPGKSLRWGDGFTKWNNSGVQNKEIFDAWTKMNKGEITPEQYKEIFDAWAIPLGGRPVQIRETPAFRTLTGNNGITKTIPQEPKKFVIMPHPYIYYQKQGGILKAQKGTPNNGLPPWIKRDDSTRTYITAFKPGDKDGRSLLRDWQRGEGKQLIRDSSLVKRIGKDGRYIYIPRSLAGGMSGGFHISEITGENKDSDEFMGRLRFVGMTEDGLYEYYDPLTGQNELYDTQFENGGKIHIKAKW